MVTGMKQRRRRDTRLYYLGDYLAAAGAWALFFVYRQGLEARLAGLDIDGPLAQADPKLYVGLAIVPVAWLLLYALLDSYSDVYRLSRLATIVRTLWLTAIGVTVLFFTLILDDFVTDYRTYYRSYAVLFGLHLTLTLVARMAILTWASRRLKAGLVGFNTLIIGGNARALELYRDITGRDKSLGYLLRGYLSTNGDDEPLAGHLPLLGRGEDALRAVVSGYNIEEVLIATEPEEHGRLRGIVDVLFEYGGRILVRVTPDMYDILLGNVRMSNVYGALVIEIEQHLVTKPLAVAKRVFDATVSLAALVLLSPLFALLAVRTRMSSPGPVIFRQERIGRFGEPFEIYKFRSMRTDAEADGPQLSSDRDPRVTPWGATMRKWRLDELPQFWNVLRGDMSLVGPRPERQHFIDLIMREAPHYRHLLKVRPGITSWGQVKFGYASTLEQMLDRLRFDILYIENMSFTLDVKILFYTLLVLVQGRGK